MGAYNLNVVCKITSVRSGNMGNRRGVEKDPIRPKTPHRSEAALSCGSYSREDFSIARALKLGDA